MAERAEEQTMDSQQMRRKDDGRTGGAVMESMAEGREDEGRVFALDFIVTLGERVLGGCVTGCVKALVKVEGMFANFVTLM
jgi:hypothetical protein